jgi:hypothetical protein
LIFSQTIVAAADHIQGKHLSSIDVVIDIL